MTTIHLSRPSVSPYIQSVSSIAHTSCNLGTAIPDGYWDIVILRQKNLTTVLCTGMLTHWMPVERQAGDELLTISLKPSVHVPRLTGLRLADQALALQTAGDRAFYLDGSWLEIPSFNNAETFVSKLVRVGILANDIAVETALLGQSIKTSARTLRRHFLKTTGVTQQYLQSIARVRQSVALLQQGKMPLWVAAETGYFDQAQMTKHVKQITGQTPGAIYQHGLHTTKDLSLL